MSLLKRIKDLEDALPKIVISNDEPVARAEMSATASIPISSTVVRPLRTTNNIPIIALESVKLWRNGATSSLTNYTVSSNYNSEGGVWDYDLHVSSNQLFKRSQVVFEFSAPFTKNVVGKVPIV